MSTGEWIKQEFDKESRTPSLESALLRGGMRKYVFYRLRFFFLRILATAVVHALELPFIFHSVRLSSVPIVLLFAAGAHLITQWWWAALESMRIDVRDLVNDKRSFQVGTLVSRWIRLSISLAGGVFVAGFAAAVAISHPQFGHLFPTELAVLLIYLTRAVLDIPVTTYYSGIYAVRRVSRPVALVFLVDLLGLASAFVLRPWLGNWAFPASLLFFGLIQSGMAVYFIHQMYRFVGWEVPPPIIAKKYRLPIKTLVGKRITICGLAGIVMALDSLLIIGLSIPHQGADNHRLVIVMFLVAPLLRACHDWVFLFFPDFLRLNLGLFQHLYRQFVRALQNSAWFVACTCWLLSIAASYLLLGQYALRITLLLLPLYIVRSMLAFEQIRAFSSRHFFDIILAGICFIGGVAAISELAVSDRAKIISLSVLYLPIILITALRRYRWLAESDSTALALPSVWFNNLSKCPGGSSICSIELSHDSTGADRHRLVRYLANEVHPHGSITTIKDRTILLFDSRPGTKDRVVEALTEAAGLFDRLRWFSDPSSCIEWAGETLRKRALELHSAGGAAADQMADEQVCTLFHSIFSNGQSIRLDKTFVADDLPEKVTAAILGGAIDFAEHWQHGEQFVSALMNRDIIAVIFIIPPGDKGRRLAALSWERYLAWVNLRRAIVFLNQA